MKPFDRNAKCPKCGRDEIQDHYDPKGNHHRPWETRDEPNRISRMCRGCHFQWWEAPLDVGQDCVGTEETSQRPELDELTRLKVAHARLSEAYSALRDKWLSEFPSREKEGEVMDIAFFPYPPEWDALRDWMDMQDEEAQRLRRALGEIQKMEQRLNPTDGEPIILTSTGRVAQEALEGGE